LSTLETDSFQRNLTTLTQYDIFKIKCDTNFYMKKSENLRVIITGANGFVAKNVRNYLSKNGVNLFSISRTNFRTFKSEKKIITSKYDKIGAISQFKNSDALVHLIGVGRETVDATFQSVNVDLTKNILNLCKKAKIKKIIYISGLGITKDSTSPYFISKYKAEKEIIKSGLDYTIFRASYIIGKNDPLTKNLNQQIKNGTIIIPGSGNYHLQPIFVMDVAKVIHSAITSKKFSKKILELVGPQTISYIEYVKIFKNKNNVKIKKIDLEKMKYEALHNPKSYFGTDDLNILVGDFQGNHKTLKMICGFNFKKFKEVLKSCSLTK
jgi:nucleoside-diphosphate-sugar epimerase